MRRTSAIDMPLFLFVLILVGVGIASVYSASYPQLVQEKGGQGFGLALRQIGFAGVGLFLMMGCILVPLRAFQRMRWGIICFMIGLLILVLAFGPMLHGNRAWIQVGPFGRFQPSELAKVAVVLVLSAYLAKCPWAVKSWRGILSGPIWFLLVPVALIAAQGDLGTVFVISSGIIALLALGGMKFRFWGVPVLALFIIGALGISLMMQTGHGGHRVERFKAWMNPFNEKIPQSYQPRFSLLAVGSGGLLGRGLCQSREKWFYLPGAHNDYIFAIIAEELGFVKVILVLFLPYILVIYRGFIISHSAPDEYGALVAGGCTAMLAIQALINMAVVLNVIPCMGINLPFISSGGSSMFASMMMAGLILNVSTTRPPTRLHRRERSIPQPVTG